MTHNNKTIAILPIRSGSKRVKDKNIRTVGYYPLFYHAITTCLEVKEIDRIFVSVDCEMYKKKVEFYFHDNDRVRVFIRPPEISTDNSKSESTMLHALDTAKENGESYDYAILVQATTPLTKSKDIKSGLKMLQESTPLLNSTFSAAESKRFYIDDVDILMSRPNTQDKNVKIYENGCFWCVRVEAFKQAHNRIIKPFRYIIVDEYDALDIDTYKDLYVVDMLLSKKTREKYNRYYKIRKLDNNFANKVYYSDKMDPDGKVRNLLDEKKERIDFAKGEIEYINSLPKKLKKNKMSLLSIGCGAGYAESEISNIFYKYGVEPDLEAYKISKQFLNEVINNTFDVSYYKKNSLDVVFCHHVIEHIRKPVDFIKDVYSILKPGGKLIIGTPNFDSAMARLYGDGFRMLHDKTHISLFSDFSLNELLKDNMFLIEKIDYPYFDTKYFNIENISKLFSDDKVSPPFYGSIFTIYAEKK
jgi:CMP-N-acetylneuraminic acid synthetase/2-polyprenyl-3-methyl-5-hydroxy-6-metoxy-1,4-benzoquinol methylase